MKERHGSSTGLPSRRPLHGLLLTFIAGFALLTGCESVEKAVRGLDKPSARLRSATLSDIALDQATLALDVQVRNPYSVALPILGIDYTLTSGTSTLVSGSVDDNTSIPAGGRRNIPMTVVIPYADVLNMLPSVQLGSVVPYAAEVGLRLDAIGLSDQRLSVTHNDELPIPTVPKISLASLDFEDLSLNKARAVMKLDIENLNSFALELAQMDMALSLGGTRIVETGLDKPASFDGGARQTLDVPISFSPISLGMATFQMLTGSGASYDLAGSMGIDTRFGGGNWPFAASGRTPFD